jgi:hypothetical protein
MDCSAGRHLLAKLLAHLCEAEDRRLHLDAGYSSMFAYCTGRLRLSEDEAYRRIEVARLARRIPRVYTLIAEGRLSLSAAALLKPYILAPNINELVEVVSNKTVQAAREALAAFFPRPDIAPMGHAHVGDSRAGSAARVPESRPAMGSEVSRDSSRSCIEANEHSRTEQ